MISTLKAQEFQKQYGKETVNLWKHLEKTEGIRTFNGIWGQTLIISFRMGMRAYPSGGG
jgi:hypothetical protein